MIDNKSNILFLNHADEQRADTLDEVRNTEPGGVHVLPRFCGAEKCGGPYIGLLARNIASSFAVIEEPNAVVSMREFAVFDAILNDISPYPLAPDGAIRHHVRFGNDT